MSNVSGDVFGNFFFVIMMGIMSYCLCFFLFFFISDGFCRVFVGMSVGVGMLVMNW